jgi:hypothetical protein
MSRRRWDVLGSSDYAQQSLLGASIFRRWHAHTAFTSDLNSVRPASGWFYDVFQGTTILCER